MMTREQRSASYNQSLAVARDAMLKYKQRNPGGYNRLAECVLALSDDPLLITRMPYSMLAMISSFALVGFAAVNESVEELEAAEKL